MLAAKRRQQFENAQIAVAAYRFNTHPGFVRLADVSYGVAPITSRLGGVTKPRKIVSGQPTRRYGLSPLPR